MIEERVLGKRIAFEIQRFQRSRLKACNMGVLYGTVGGGHQYHDAHVL